MLLHWLRVIIENIMDKVCIFFSKMFKVKSPLITGKKASKHLLKPVFSCVICMSGIWTIILTWSFNFPLIFVVCGINVLIDKFINYEG